MGTQNRSWSRTYTYIQPAERLTLSDEKQMGSVSECT